MGVASASADDVTPVRTVDLSGSPVTVINNGPGDQVDPHISGDLVAYTDFSLGDSAGRIRFHDLSTGTDEVVPNSDDQANTLPDVSGTSVVYRHFLGSPNRRVWEFDTADPSAPPHQVEPEEYGQAYQESIGDQFLAWAGGPGNLVTTWELYVLDRADGTIEQVTHDDLVDMAPTVSPNGASIAWEKCQNFIGPCDTWSGVRASDGTWALHQLTTGEHSTGEQPGTDGDIVAYSDQRSGLSDLYWQPLAGGPESHLVMADAGTPQALSQTPAASHGVIAFLHNSEVEYSFGEFDQYAYDTNTGFLYRLTDTQDDEFLDDISVSGHTATVVFTRLGAIGDDNVYAKTFELQQPPHLTADHAQVTGDEGSQASNSGTVTDPNGDDVSLSASIGHVTNNGDGTWSWTYTPDDGPAGPQTVTITGTDPDGLTDSVSFDLNVDNVAPSATFNAPSSAAPGSTFAVSLTGPSDPSSADTSAGLTYAFDCGDGTFSPFGPSSSASCTAPASPGPVAVRGWFRTRTAV
jgi:hypothetical protein